MNSSACEPSKDGSVLISHLTTVPSSTELGALNKLDYECNIKDQQAEQLMQKRSRPKVFTEGFKFAEKIRKPTFQIGVFVLLACCTLGPYNGLNAAGGGGLSNHIFVTKVNAIYTFTLASLGWMGGIAFVKLGPRVAMGIATLFYAVFPMVLLRVRGENYSSVEAKLLPVCAGMCLGLGACILWATFGVMVISYCASDRRAKMFAIEWCSFNIGGFLCGLVGLTSAFRDKISQQVSSTMYVISVCMNVGSSVVAICLLRHQSEVLNRLLERSQTCLSTAECLSEAAPVDLEKRSSGGRFSTIYIEKVSQASMFKAARSFEIMSEMPAFHGDDEVKSFHIAERVNSSEGLVALACLSAECSFIVPASLTGHNQHASSTTFSAVFRSALACFRESTFWPLWITFFTPFIHAPLLFNGLNSSLFNVRSRNLNSSIYWFARICGGFGFYVATRAIKSPSRCAVLGGALVTLWATVSLCTIGGVLISPIWDSGDIPMDVADDFPHSVLPVTPFFAFGFLDALTQSLAYMLIGILLERRQLTGGNSAPLFSGFYKTLQSLGTCTFWCLDWWLSEWRSGTRSPSPHERCKFHFVLILMMWMGSMPGCWYSIISKPKIS